MAATQKKKSSQSGSARGTSTKRKTNAGSTSVKKAASVSTSTAQEVISLFGIIFCIFVFLCCTGTIKGAAGPKLQLFFKGLFGSFGFVLPFIVIVLIVWNFFKTNIFKAPLHPVKKVCYTILLICVGILWCFLSGYDIKTVSENKEMMKELYLAGRGGGAVFGLFACLFCKWLGTAGTIVLTILFALICLVVVTEKSFMKLIQRGGASAKDFVRKTRDNVDFEEDDELYERRLEQKRLRKEEKQRQKQLRYEEELKAREEEEELARDREIQRREAAKRKQEEARKKRDEQEELRIVNANSPASGRKLANVGANLSGEDAQQIVRNSKDEIHEIQVDDSYYEQANYAGLVSKERFESTPAGTNVFEYNAPRLHEMEEITLPIDSVEKELKPVKKVVSTIEESAQTENISTSVSTPDIEPTIASVVEEEFVKPVPATRVIEAEEVKPVSDAILYSDMPEPVTKATHEKANALLNASEPVTKERKKSTGSKEYKKPTSNLLNPNDHKHGGDSNDALKETAFKLQETLKTFGVAVTVSDISQGPSVTRYELTLGEGVKVNKIVALTDDIKLQLAAQDVRIEAPIPGKAAVGIELPNKEASPVFIRDLIDSREFKKAESPISFGVGEDISGQVIIGDIAKMPHMLIAGSTGSGKSVCINTLIMSILYNATPDEVKLIMIDPKVVELSVYNGIPHLLVPVVTDPRKANAALQWAVREMEKRYKAFADVGCRDLKGFNEKLLAGDQKALDAAERYDYDATKPVPLIVVIVDELADLMMTAAKDVEESICRLAQLARAAGIHLIIATQRPSVDVITGLIKANMPSRIAFRVSSGVDSRTILDMTGAERLLGKGDMLFYPQSYPKPLRVQGAFVSDGEVEKVVQYLREQVKDESPYDESIVASMENGSAGAVSAGGNGEAEGSMYDELLGEAARFVTETRKASAGGLQRVYRIGFNRAARILDQLAEIGIVGPENGTKPREILVEAHQLEDILIAHNV